MNHGQKIEHARYNEVMRVPPRKLYAIAGLIVLLPTLFFAWSCKKREKAPVKTQPKQIALAIGLIPEQNVFSQKERYEPLADYLSAKTDARLAIHVLSRYGNIIDNFKSLGLDGAFLGSFTGALAHMKLGLEFLARPEFLDGTSTYHGMIFVRKDSGIRTAGDMKGRRFAFVDKATTAGWLLPLWYFKTHGIDNYRTWFQEIYFTGTHEDAIYDVLEGRADIGAAKNTVFNRLAASDPRISEELTILATSPEVPAITLAVRKDLNAKIKKELKETLLNMDKNEEGRKVLRQFGALRFIETTLEDYRPVFEYADRIGLDLKTYNYMNE